MFFSHSNPPSTDFGRLSPAHRGYHLLGIKTSPYTSPIGTPGPGVIKFEPGTGGLEDHNEHKLRMDSGRATPTHGTGHRMVLKTQPRHGNGDNDDDSNDEDSMEPCDLRMDLTKALLAAAAQEGGAVALALGHSHHLSQPQHHHQQQPPQHPYSRAKSHLIFPGGAAAGQDPSSSAAAAIVAAAAAAGLAANNTNASVSGAAGGAGSITGGSAAGGASTSAAAAAAAALAAAAPVSWSGSGGGVGGNTGGGSGGGGGGGGAYACDRCGNTYARPHSLNRHVRFECGVEPKFECPICHKKSKHKHNLVLHMRTHQHR